MSFFRSQNWREAHTPLWKDPPFPSYFTLLVLILPSYKWSNRAFTAAGSWISKPLVNVLNDKEHKKGRMCITLLKIGSIKKNTLTEHHFSSFLLHLCVPSHLCPSVITISVCNKYSNCSFRFSKIFSVLLRVSKTHTEGEMKEGSLQAPNLHCWFMN